MTTRLPFVRHDVSFPSGDSSCAGWLYLPSGVASPPVVILGHGLGATRDMRLDAFAERFAQAGIAALAFTYRHFGDSGGHPRQLLSIKRQLTDWDSALDWVKARRDVDRSRIAVWGSSFGGGHAITVASRHPELCAAVAQCPFTDGLASALALGPVASLRMTPVLARDLAARIRGKAPVMVPIAASPGSPALMNAADALPGYQALVPKGKTFRNEVAARVIPTIAAYRPGRAAKKVVMPILFCVSDTDSVTPPAQTLRYARTAPHGEVKRYAAGHFDFYTGETFEALARDQVEFLTRHLAPLPASSAS
ncbi:alpha/beta hydrolase [Streptomyces diastatochromogenes]|uniref:Alpha/beta hydrolase n=1 Tax=Streptomyces diastatochromogenes TaxID=42236 RepID=A0A233STY4_STRDA|nr:alpha/beta hydrolase [Streptomyces diastatochromogenes]MCZ0985930.1 alpha/beta fold hydrolase [Streptomyces diastatochromogenes]OXY99083.1 alpha/beta hydrolase [Streptomyces diastatochromogenes]